MRLNRPPSLRPRWHRMLLAVLALCVAGAIMIPVPVDDFWLNDSVNINPVAPSPMPGGNGTVQPLGYVLFCNAHPQECSRTAQAAAVVVMTPEKRQQLDDVQWQVNRAVRPDPKPAVAWFYPTGGAGNCTSYALEKRRELLAEGWPAMSILLATAIVWNGEGHLVVVVRTSEGDLVLDNLQRRVVDWSTLSYKWVARQSDVNPSDWVQIGPALAVVSSIDPGPYRM